MSKIRIIENITYPSLSMEKVEKNTSIVVDSNNTKLSIGANHMIHLSLSTTLASFDNSHRMILRFRQANNNTDDVDFNVSTERYIHSHKDTVLKYVVENGIVYREVDITRFFSNENKKKYFSITSPTDLTLYTSTASSGYKPELRVVKIAENDFLQHQAEIEGTIRNDNYKVNLRSGKLYYGKHLLSVETTDSVMSLCMNYNIANRNVTNIKSGYQTGLGYGFKFNYQQLVYTTGSNYIFVDGEYKLHTFKLADNLSDSSAEKVYYDTSGSYMILEKLSTGYKIIKQNQTLEFDSAGKLTKISIQTSENNTYEEMIEYDSSNRINRIFSGTNEIIISYGSVVTKTDRSQEQKITITGSNSQSVIITLIDSNLTSVTNVNGLITVYEHETVSAQSTYAIRPLLPLSTRLLKSVTEGNDKVEFDFYDSYKMKLLSRYYNGNLISTEKLVYEGIETQVLKSKRKVGSTLNLQSIDMRYQFNTKGEIENTYELVGDEVFGLVHYDYNHDESEVMTFDSGEESYVDDCELSSNRTISITGAMDNGDKLQIKHSGEYVLALGCRITLEKSLISSTDKIQAEIYQNGNLHSIIDFDLLDRLMQFKFTKLTCNLNDEIDIKLVNNTTSYKAYFSSIVLTPKQSNKETSCINVESGSVLAEYSNQNLYKNNLNKIQYLSIDGLLLYATDVFLSSNDIAETQRQINFSPSASEYNVWYNNGEGMLYKVKNVQPSIGTSEYIGMNNIINTTSSSFVLKNLEGENFVCSQITCITFDSDGYSVHTINTFEDDPSSNTTVLTRYDKYNKIISKCQNDAVTKEYSYDNHAKNTKITITCNGEVVEEKYEYANGKRISTTNDFGTESYMYNAAGNLISVTKNNEVIKNLSYRTDLQTITNVGTIINNVNSNTRFEYDSNLIETGHYSTNCNFEYEYDDCGRISVIKENGTAILSYEYIVDSTQTTVLMTNRSGGVVKNIYDRYGNMFESYKDDVLVLKCEFLNFKNKLASDAKLKKKYVLVDNQMKIYEYFYDYYGCVTKIIEITNNEVVYSQKSGLEYNSDYNQVVEYKDDLRISQGNVVKEELLINNHVDTKQKQYNYYTYYGTGELDNEDNISSNDLSLKSLEQIYPDNLGRLSNIRCKIANIVFDKSYAYQTHGINEQNEVVTSNLISNETLTRSVVEGEPEEITQISYSYVDGQISSIVKSDNTIIYEYDSLGRIKKEINPKLNINRTYTYDSEGNMHHNDKTFVYDGQKLISYDGHTLTYMNGYLSNYKGMSVEFAFDKLMQYNTTVFQYDGLGKRIRKTTSNLSRDFYYDQSGRLIKESLSNGKNIEYLYGNKGIIGFIYDAETYYYSRNILGDVEAIYNSTGSLVASYEYDAWGNHYVYNPDATTNTSELFIGNINPIRYRGYYYDVETGLFMVGHRYYSPELCRFIQPADVSTLNPSSINGLNLYEYANNNPIGIAYSSSSVGFGASGGMIGSTIGTISNIVGSGSVGGGSKVSGFGSLSGSSFGGINWPKANSVAMTHYTTLLIENAFIGSFFGNISYTETTQLNDSERFYSYSNTGNGGYSAGVGMNLGNWYGISAYVSSNLGFGTSMQLTSRITYGAEISLQDGISFSFGTISGNTTQEITVNVGWGTIAGAYLVCAGIAAIPMPGARALAGAAACVILLIDIFN